VSAFPVKLADAVFQIIDVRRFCKISFLTLSFAFFAAFDQESQEIQNRLHVFMSYSFTN